MSKRLNELSDSECHNSKILNSNSFSQIELDALIEIIEMKIYEIARTRNSKKFGDLVEMIELKYPNSSDLILRSIDYSKCVSSADHLMNLLGENFNLMEQISKEQISKGQNIINAMESLFVQLLNQCDDKHIVQLQKLLDNGVMVKKNVLTQEILFTCCRKKSIKQILLMKENGIDIQQIDQVGHNFLHIACRSNFMDGVKLALSCGINVNAPSDNGLTPLHHLCVNDVYYAPDVRCEIAQLLLDEGDSNGRTLLHSLCFVYFENETQFINRIDEILDFFSDRNLQDNSFSTPLDLLRDKLKSFGQIPDNSYGYCELKKRGFLHRLKMPLTKQEKFNVTHQCVDPVLLEEFFELMKI